MQSKTEPVTPVRRQGGFIQAIGKYPHGCFEDRVPAGTDVHYRGSHEHIRSHAEPPPGKQNTGLAAMAMDIAFAYAALGDKDQAFAWLDKAVERRDLVIFLKYDPNSDRLQSDPRFDALIRRLGLAP